MSHSQGPHEDSRHTIVWRTAKQWRQRARHARAGGVLGGLQMLLAWLLFGILTIITMTLGLFFLLLGWAMLPLMRYRMKKRMERMRADQAADAGGSFHHSGHHSGHHGGASHRETGNHEAGGREPHVLEGDFEVKERGTARDSASR